MTSGTQPGLLGHTNRCAGYDAAAALLVSCPYWRPTSCRGTQRQGVSSRAAGGQRGLGRTAAPERQAAGRMPLGARGLSCVIRRSPPHLETSLLRVVTPRRCHAQHVARCIWCQSRCHKQQRQQPPRHIVGRRRRGIWCRSGACQTHSRANHAAAANVYGTQLGPLACLQTLRSVDSIEFTAVSACCTYPAPTGRHPGAHAPPTFAVAQ